LPIIKPESAMRMMVRAIKVELGAAFMVGVSGV
jgi:hypothetical protein